MNTHYTVTEAAMYIGVTVKTLQRWDRENILVPARTKTNRRYYTPEQLREYMNIKVTPSTRKSIAYIRVSSPAQKPDLKNQREAVENFCIARGLSSIEYIEEVGGGLNFNRKHFNNIIKSITNKEIETLVVAHKDRLARFGFDLIKNICAANNTELLVINSERLSPEQEVTQDLMTIIHCFSSRLYGLRNYKKTLQEALKK